jgi:hypothetical protein
VVVDTNQVEKLKEERRMVLEQETGQEAGILLWVAERLNADVYVELDARTSAESSGGDYYATANLTAQMYETSTGQLLGAVNRRSQRTFSRTSREDAVLNALQSTVYQAMPRVLDQARAQMAQFVSRGVRYELVLQSTPDARALARFRSRLRGRVEDLDTVSQTAEETVLEVRMYGGVEELEETVYDLSDTVPGFEGLYLVLKRGKSVTFNTGM